MLSCYYLLLPVFGAQLVALAVHQSLDWVLGWLVELGWDARRGYVFGRRDEVDDVDGGALGHEFLGNKGDLRDVLEGWKVGGVRVGFFPGRRPCLSCVLVCTHSADLQTTVLSLFFLLHSHLYLRTAIGCDSRTGHNLFLNFRPKRRWFSIEASIGRRGFFGVRVALSRRDDLYLPAARFSGLRIHPNAGRILKVKGWAAGKESRGAASSWGGLVAFEESVVGVAEHGVWL